MRVQIIGGIVVTATALAFAVGAGEPAKGFDLSALDRSADPCNDFFQDACGGWTKANPIPGDQSAWGRFDELILANNGVLREILEKASASGATRTPVDQKIGDYYAACMDEKGLDAKGKTPLQPELGRIAALATKAQIAEAVGRLHVLGSARSSRPAPIRISRTFTPEQRFFLGFGQACETRRDEYSRMLAEVDVHSPGRYRINGTVANMPEFANAFACKPGAPMARAEKACRVW